MLSSHFSCEWPALEQTINRQPLRVFPQTTIPELLELIGCFANQVTGRNQAFSVLVTQATAPSAGEELCGMLSAQDILGLSLEANHPQDLRVEHFMKKPVALSLSEQPTLAHALVLLRKHCLDQLPILNANGKLAGVVTPESILLRLHPVNIFNLIPVTAIANSQPLLMPASASVLELAQAMIERQRNWIVVTQTTPASSPSRPCWIPLGLISINQIQQAMSNGIDLSTPLPSHLYRQPGATLTPQATVWDAYESIVNKQQPLWLVGPATSSQFPATQLCLQGIITPRNFLKALEPEAIYAAFKRSQQSIVMAKRDQVEALQQRNRELEQQLQQAQGQVQLALAVTNRKTQQAHLLNQIVEAIRSTLIVDEILQTTANQVHEALQVSRCLIFRPDSHNQMRVRHVSMATEQPEEFLGVMCDFYHYYEPLLAKGQPVILSSIDAHLPQSVQKAAQGCEIQAGLIIPLIYRNIWLGGISLHQCDRPREWSVDEISFVQAIANHCTVAIQQSQLYQRLAKELLEKEQIETALREQQAFLRHIIDANPNLIFVKDWQGKFILANQATANIYQTSLENLIGKTDADVNPYPEEVEQFLEADRQVITSLQPVLISEETVSNSLSETRYFQTIKQPLELPNGQVHLLGVATDITERKLAQEAVQKLNAELEAQVAHRTLALQRTVAALRHSEKRFRVALKSAQMGVWEWDLQKNYVRRSRQVQAILGYEVGCMSHQPAAFFQTIHPEDLPQVQQEIARVLADPQPFYEEMRIVWPDGSIRWGACMGDVICNAQGQPVQMTGVMVDITERKAAQAAFDESEMQLQLALKAVGMGTWDWNIQSDEIKWSDQTQQIFGFTSASFPGTFEAFWERVHVDDRQMMQQKITEACEQHKLYEIEHRLCLPDGTVRWVAAKGNVLRDSTNRPVRMTGVVMDITQNKQAEVELRESEARYRLLAENATDLISRHRNTPEAEFLYASPVSQKLLGYTPEELVGVSPYSLFHPEDVSVVNYTHQLVLKSFNYEPICYRMRRKDSTYIWLETISQSVRDPNTGTVQEIVSVSRDITTRKQTEEMLQLRERAIIASNNGIVIVDARLPDKPVIYVNPAFEKMTGYGASEVMGKNCRFLQKNDRDQEELIKLRSAINAGEACSVILRNYKKDGTFFWNELSISPIYDAQQQLTHFIGIQIDITERKQAEVALLLSRERLQYLLASSPAVIYCSQTSANNAITFMSENVSAMLGYEAEEFLKNTNFWVDHIHPDERAEFFQRLPQLCQTNHAVSEYRFLHKDGNYRWMYDQVKLVRDEEGNPLEIIGYWADITDRKNAETQLQATNEQLRAVLDAVPGTVSWINSDLHYLGVNSQLASLMNLTPEAFAGKPLGFLANSPDFTEFMTQFLKGSHTSAKQMITTKINQETRNYLLVAQKYQQGSAAVSVGIDITDRQQAQEQIQASLKEKEVLLKEIHHRVKNNLQIVSSLLKLQSGYIKDQEAQELFKDSYNRVRSMALIHEKLYRSSDLARIDLKDYIGNLVTNLVSSYRGRSNPIEVHLNIENISLDIDTAIPCGLIINELVSNAFKYAFADQSPGKIQVEFLGVSEQSYQLKVSDNGAGLPEGFDLEQAETLGLQLVFNLTEQLEGTIEVDNNQGACFIIKFLKK